MNAQTEWANYLKLFNSGVDRSVLLKAARAMQNPANKNAALLNLGIATAKQRKEIATRWEAINNTTDAECRAHCQFEGLPKIG